MAFYSSPEIAHVRGDVCGTCHGYLKSTDLTRTGLVVPVVDELATIPLDLWAREHGYEKLQINLLGVSPPEDGRRASMLNRGISA